MFYKVNPQCGLSDILNPPYNQDIFVEFTISLYKYLQKRGCNNNTAMALKQGLRETGQLSIYFVIQAIWLF